jgi:hypothetical protein
MNISPQGLAEIVLPTMQVVKDQQKEIERLEAEVKRVTEFYGKTPMSTFRILERLTAELAKEKAHSDTLWIQSADRATKIDVLEAENAVLKQWETASIKALEEKRAENSALHRDREQLAKAIRDAAVIAGICSVGADLTGPQLLLLCSDIVEAKDLIYTTLANTVIERDALKADVERLMKEISRLSAINFSLSTGLEDDTGERP